MKTKANIVNRLLAGAVDFGIAVVIYYIFKKPFNTIIASIFILFRDSLGGGKSIGKIIFNLNTKKIQDETPAAYRESILRNFFFIIPIINYFMVVLEAFLIYWDINGSRVGDRIAETFIIDDDTKLNQEIQKTFIETPEHTEKK